MGVAIDPASPSDVQGRSYALIIGIDEYDDDQLTDLNGATRDAKAVAKVLEQQGFEITLLLNREAHYRKIIEVLSEDLQKQINSAQTVNRYYTTPASTASSIPLASRDTSLNNPISDSMANPSTTVWAPTERSSRTMHGVSHSPARATIEPVRWYRKRTIQAGNKAFSPTDSNPLGTVDRRPCQHTGTRHRNGPLISQFRRFTPWFTVDGQHTSGLNRNRRRTTTDGGHRTSRSH